ncbi:hypothetical protein BURMUCF2_3129 [Burkholderia multivorans CF2]|nr:hypothetical protein BURMUCF2_3129 [Burkholderia multivorans CF2]
MRGTVCARAPAGSAVGVGGGRRRATGRRMGCGRRCAPERRQVRRSA